MAGEGVSNPNFGLVILVIFFSIGVHHAYMAVQVTKARKKYGVRYPLLYAPPEHKDAEAFNCVQRGHQNSLENLPAHLATTLVVGMKYPIFAAVTGLIYVVGRILYFNGYATGIPKNRFRGHFMYLGSVPQYLALGVTGFQLLLSR